MLRRITTLLLLTVLISSNCSHFFIMAGYRANQKLITTIFCENQARPWLHCNGKCYLMKKIRQAAENEKKQAEKETQSRLEINFCQAINPMVFMPQVVTALSSKPFWTLAYHYQNIAQAGTFKPPRLVV